VVSCLCIDFSHREFPSGKKRFGRLDADFRGPELSWGIRGRRFLRPGGGKKPKLMAKGRFANSPRRVERPVLHKSSLDGFI